MKKGKKDLKEEVKKDEGEDFQEQFLRVKADFENFRKRVEVEKVEMRRRSKFEVFEKLLPVLDNFERAVGCAPEDEWSSGVCQLFGNFESEMGELGFEKIVVQEGDDFDAGRMEAVLSEENEGMKDKVMEVLQVGWNLEGEVVRPSKVRVGV